MDFEVLLFLTYRIVLIDNVRLSSLIYSFSTEMFFRFKR